MKAIRSIITLLSMCALLANCTNVGLENASQGSVGPSIEQPETSGDEPVVDLGPGSQIKNADQLLNPKTIDSLLSGVTDCIDINSDVFSCLLLVDSFERLSIDESIANSGFGWSSLIDDVLGANGDRVEVAIYNDTQLGETPDAITGPANDLGRSLLFTGRPGGSVHSVFLVSQPLDLSAFNSVLIGFEYLEIALETWTWLGVTGNENIRLEVCESDLTSCGVLPSLSEAGLNSTNWVGKFQNAIGAGQGQNGHNHVLADWKKAAINIDISQMPEAIKQNFVFRISVTLDEGFIATNILGNLEDGIALDNVVALASKVTVPLNVDTVPDEASPNPSID